VKQSKLKPWQTVFSVFYNVEREAPRTLYSFSPAYQHHVEAEEYSLVALDHGSSRRLNLEKCDKNTLNWQYHYIETDTISSVEVINEAVAKAETEYLLIFIAGARILTPGLLYRARQMSMGFDNPFIYRVR
jgi:hypothetical protein